LHLHLFVIPSWFDYAFCAATVLIAAVFGGWRERVIALTWAFPDFLLPGLVREYVCTHWCAGGPVPISPWLALACDVVMLAACVWGARRTDRYWIIWTGSFALLAVLTDGLAIVARGVVTEWAYLSADEAWWCLMGGATIWGCLSPGRGLRQDERRPRLVPAELDGR
jgi:hypothetical protein